VAPQGLQKEPHYPMARTKACSGCRSLSSTLSFTRDRARAGGDRSSPISTEDISHVCTQHHPMLKGSTQSAGGAQSAKLQIPGFLLCPRAVSQHLEGPNVIPAHGILQLCFPAGFETDCSVLQISCIQINLFSIPRGQTLIPHFIISLIKHFPLSTPADISGSR